MNHRKRNGFALFTALMLMSANFSMAGNTSGLPNLPFPTHGGKFIWQDVHIYADWRIQKNLLSDHYRLLDEYDVRRAWGTYDDMKTALDGYKTSENLAPRSSDMVMLIHGITPVVNPFEEIEPALKKKGYDTVKISYPSTLSSIENHAKSISHIIRNLEGTQRIHFVTHSMGGLVLRHLLANKKEWGIEQQIGRIILIAPPNKGAALARMLEDFPPFRFVYGQAGQDLSPEQAKHIPPLRHSFIIIAGGRGDGKGYNPIIDGDDDGTVAVSETELMGSRQTYVLPALHSDVGNTKEAVTIITKEIESAPKINEIIQ